MNNGPTERAAVYAVGAYLNRNNKFAPRLDDGGNTPIVDGYFNIYKNEQQKVDDFFAQIPVQVKGTASDKDYYFRIGREYVDAYKQLGGIVFFKVIVNETTPTILYAILSLDRINELQKQSTKEIRIDLNEVPTDPQKFETEIFAFASKRNGEKVENSSHEEIEDLVKGFEKIRGYLCEIKDNEAKYELESLLDSIKKTRDDGTIGWRDKFIYYSRKALDLATSNLIDCDFVDLLFQLGAYLHKQKQYHLVEDYYLKALEENRKRKNLLNEANILNNLASLHDELNRKEKAEREYKEALIILQIIAKVNRDACIATVAGILNNLGLLHYNLTRNNEAEKEYKEALEIYRELAKTNREAYIGYVSAILNNIAILHKNLTLYNEAEQEFQEALEIRRELAKSNREDDLCDVAMTLVNLGELHRVLTHYKEAEQEYLETLKIYRELATRNRDLYIEFVAVNLNNLAILHMDLSLYEEAAKELEEALEIRRELAKTNRDVYIGKVALNLNNLGLLHNYLNRIEQAEQEYLEALIIRRELAKINPDTFIGKVANTLFNLALLLQMDEKRLHEARDAANEALDIYKGLAKRYPQIWNSYVEDTRRLLDELQKPNPPA